MVVAGCWSTGGTWSSWSRECEGAPAACAVLPDRASTPCRLARRSARGPLHRLAPCKAYVELPLFCRPDDGERIGKDFGMDKPPVTRTWKRGPDNAGSRLRATAGRGAVSAPRRAKPGVFAAWLVVLHFFAALAILWYFGRIPAYVIAAYGAMSPLTFLWYWSDKRSAERGAWRTSESLLHWLELACGWPGALAAQWQLRHKNRKQEYQAVFWFIVVAHVGVLGWLTWSGSLAAAKGSGAFSRSEERRGG